MKNNLYTLLLSPLIAALATRAPANILTPTHWARGGADTAYAEWNIFNSPGGPNAPDVGSFGASASWNAFDSSGASLVTSGGNIYSFGSALKVQVYAPGQAAGASNYTTVMFQARTLGTEADYANVKLIYNDGANDITLLPVASKESDRISLGGFGGFQVDVAYEFQVPFSPALMKIQFPAAGSSMSLDVLAVDSITTPSTTGFITTPVPEPTSTGLLTLGAFTLLPRRKRTA